MGRLVCVLSMTALLILQTSCRTTEKDSETKGLLGGGQKVKPNRCVSTGQPIPGSQYSLVKFPGLDQEWAPCAETEKREFEKFSAGVKELQLKHRNSQKQHPEKGKDFKFRGFHAKSHGCLAGEMTVNNPATRGTKNTYRNLRRFRDASEPSAYGLFAERNKKFAVYVRFSSAQGEFQNDRSPDGKGIAIKVMDAGPSLNGSHDFTMSNTPICNAATAEEFMTLVHSVANGLGATAKLLTKKVERNAILGTLASGAKWKPSIASEQYWTRTAFKMGPYAAKYSVKPEPCPGQNADTVDTSALDSKRYGEYLRFQKNLTKLPNYYLEELEARAKKQDICFGVYTQFQTDPMKTPVENPAILWSEKTSPPIRLARIKLPTNINQEFNTAENKDFCERLGFSPEFFIKEHAPMGHMNRARLAVYKSSREFRQKQYQKAREPKTLTNLPLKN